MEPKLLAPGDETVGYQRSQIPSTSASKTKKKCPYCPFSSYYSTSLTVHLRRHTGEKPYQCPYCTKVKLFGDRSNMNSHIKRFHKDARARKMNSVISSLYGVSGSPPEIATLSSSLRDHLGYVGTSGVSPPAILRNEQWQLTTKANRRKPAFVRKQSASSLDLNDNVLSSSSEERLFTQRDVQNQSEEEENLHAFHRTNAEVDNILKAINQTEEDMVDEQTPMTSTSVVDETEVKNSRPSTECMYTCKHCDIYFKSCVLHTLHMGCHGYDDPFKCNTCGAKCEDAIEFHCHFARGNHSGEI